MVAPCCGGSGGIHGCDTSVMKDVLAQQAGPVSHHWWTMHMQLATQQDTDLHNSCTMGQSL